jgi:hypothetical protein
MTMLKRTIVAAVAVVLPLFAAADVWVDMDDHNAFMLVSKSVATTKGGNRVSGFRIWIREMDTTLLSLFEVDCMTAPTSSRLLSVTIRDKSGKEIGSHDYPNNTWSFNTPDNGLTDLFVSLCDMRRGAGT